MAMLACSWTMGSNTQKTQISEMWPPHPFPNLLSSPILAARSGQRQERGPRFLVPGSWAHVPAAPVCGLHTQNHPGGPLGLVVHRLHPA